MAKVTVESRTEIETKTVEHEVRYEDFIITLTEHEAKELMALTGCLAPCLTGSKKGPTVSLAIYTKLSIAFDKRNFPDAKRRHVRMDGIKPMWV